MSWTEERIAKLTRMWESGATASQIADELGGTAEALRIEAGEPYFQLTLSRNYKDRNGAWQRSHHFSVRDLPHLALAVDWALKELLMKPE